MRSKLEKVISQSLHVATEIIEENKSNAFVEANARDKIYLVTDSAMRPFFDDIPEDRHVLDELIKAFDVIKDLRFEFSYLESTQYNNYVRIAEELITQIRGAGRLNQVSNH